MFNQSVKQSLEYFKIRKTGVEHDHFIEHLMFSIVISGITTPTPTETDWLCICVDLLQLDAEADVDTWYKLESETSG